jgi:hypothetical protein
MSIETRQGARMETNSSSKQEVVQNDNESHCAWVQVEDYEAEEYETVRDRLEELIQFIGNWNADSPYEFITIILGLWNVAHVDYMVNMTPRTTDELEEVMVLIEEWNPEHSQQFFAMVLGFWEMIHNETIEITMYPHLLNETHLNKKDKRTEVTNDNAE